MRCVRRPGDAVKCGGVGRGFSVVGRVHPVRVESQSLVGFAQTARALAAGARAAGLVVPAFRTPPKRPDAVRTIRQLPGGAVVAVRVRGRSSAEIVADMVEGVVRANGLTGEAATRWRNALLAAVMDPPATRGSAAA
jgi:hypothetical protein